MHGSESFNRPSRFLTELPRAGLVEVRPRVQVQRPVASGRDAAHWDDEDDSQEWPTLQLGQRVRHQVFGEGVVIGAEGRGQHARVHVNFEREGAKWLVLAYAKLAPL